MSDSTAEIHRCLRTVPLVIVPSPPSAAVAPPPPPPPPPSPCPFYMGSPVHSSASTTDSLSFACPYQTSGSIKRTVFLHPPPKSFSVVLSLCFFSSFSFFFIFFVSVLPLSRPFSCFEFCLLHFPYAFISSVLLSF